MPGLLKENAACPKCGDQLIAIVRTTNRKGVTAEFHHEKGSPKARRRRFCKVFYPEPLSAADQDLVMQGSLA